MSQIASVETVDKLDEAEAIKRVDLRTKREVPFSPTHRKELSSMRVRSGPFLVPSSFQTIMLGGR